MKTRASHGQLSAYLARDQRLKSSVLSLSEASLMLNQQPGKALETPPRCGSHASAPCNGHLAASTPCSAQIHKYGCGEIVCLSAADHLVCLWAPMRPILQHALPLPNQPPHHPLTLPPAGSASSCTPPPCHAAPSPQAKAKQQQQPLTALTAKPGAAKDIPEGFRIPLSPEEQRLATLRQDLLQKLAPSEADVATIAQDPVLAAGGGSVGGWGGQGRDGIQKGGKEGGREGGREERVGRHGSTLATGSNMEWRLQAPCC
jgi:hypothetical protein